MKRGKQDNSFHNSKTFLLLLHGELREVILIGSRLCSRNRAWSSSVNSFKDKSLPDFIHSGEMVTKICSVSRSMNPSEFSSTGWSCGPGFSE